MLKIETSDKRTNGHIYNRINRVMYLKRILLICSIFGVSFFYYSISFWWYLPLLYYYFRSNVKRCHDLDKSGWYQFNGWFFIKMFIQEGDTGLNTYGVNPMCKKLEGEYEAGLSTLIGFFIEVDHTHDWNFCKCWRCKMERDEAHSWNDLRCTICGKTRSGLEKENSLKREAKYIINIFELRKGIYSLIYLIIIIIVIVIALYFLNYQATHYRPY